MLNANCLSAMDSGQLPTGNRQPSNGNLASVDSNGGGFVSCGVA
jgi:hypothetical protein